MKTLFIFLSTIFCLSSFAQTNGWTKLGTIPHALGSSDFILTICSDASGNIYAAGGVANNNGYNYVAKWNGTNWAELGAGINALNANNPILTICTDGLGNIYAAGEFTDSISFFQGHKYVAKWNGTTWAELGTDTNALNANGPIPSIFTDALGNVYAAGYFTNADGYYYVAKWNGTTWSELGTDTNALNANNPIESIFTDSAGNIYASGGFSNAYGYFYLAKWNGTSWSELGTGSNALNANYAILSICTDGSGNIYAAGYFTNSSGKHYIAKWDGTTWTELGGTNALNANGNTVSICADAYKNIYAAGAFTNAASKYYVAKYNGTNWADFGNHVDSANSLNGLINVVYADASGNVYAGNNFPDTAGKRCVMKWTNPTPAVNASNMYFTTIDSTSLSVGFTKGNGKKRLVVCGLVPLTKLPIDNVIYTASSIFKSGYQLDSNIWVVYNDTGNFVNVSGLNICTKYYFSVFEYNVDSANAWYLRYNYLQGIDSTKFHQTLKIITSTGDSTYCSYTNFFIEGNNYTDVNYQWYKNGISVSGANNYADSNISSSGIYSLKISKNNCSLSSNNLSITINPKPKSGFKMNNPTQCLIGNNFSFDDTTSTTNMRLWDLGDLTTNTNDTFSKSYSNAGTYQVKLKVVDIHNCIDSSSKTILVKANPAKPSIIALTKSLLQSSVANSYQWYLNNSIISSATNQSLAITVNGNYSVKIDTTNDCTNTSNIFTASSVGENEVYINNEIKIYPNPAHDEFDIETTNIEKLNVQLFDITGKELSETIQFVKSVKFTTEALSEGIYFVRITNSNSKIIKTQKVAVVR